MFEILKNQDANSENLAEAYVKAEEVHRDLEEQKNQAYQELMDLQKDFLDPGSKPPKELKDAKGKFDDLAIRCGACTHGLGQLKSRIAERLPKEVEERLDVIAKEFVDIREEKERLDKAFLDAVAKAVVLKEEIAWRAMIYSSLTGKGTEVPPGLKVEYCLLVSEDQKYLWDRMKEYREKSEVKSFADSLKGKESFLGDEKGKLESLRQGFDSDVETERLLSRFRPKQEGVETVEPEPGPKRSSPVPESLTRDAPIDYGEGLKFKGGEGFSVTPVG